jgi:polar amino acid transport system permease protein
MDFITISAESIPILLKGALVSLELYVLTIVFALPLGLPVALGENSRVRFVSWICRGYVTLFRGTPLMLQLMFFYYCLPIIFGPSVGMNPTLTAVITFVLNYASYFAEIYRGGLNSIDRGQYEAAHSLGLSRRQTMRGIIIPQTMRVVLPPVSNELINLVKDTALAMVISLPELMQKSSEIVNRTAGNLVPYLYAAILYLLFTMVLTYFLHRLEQRFSRYSEKEA